MSAGVSYLDPASFIALVMVVLIGLPHGAFDGAVARYLGFAHNVVGAVRFICLYILTAAIVIIIWIIFPGMALAGFLLISAVHFGWGDANAQSRPVFIMQIAAHGGLIVFGIGAMHLPSVTPLFSVLADGMIQPALVLIKAMWTIMPGLAILYFILAIIHAEIRIRFAELIIISAMIFILPPLVGFAVYFCMIHTIRHLRHIWQRLHSLAQPRQIILQACLFTLASWSMGAIAFLGLDSGNIEADLLQVIFIGIAALTMPHMILVDGLFRRAPKHHKDHNESS